MDAFVLGGITRSQLSQGQGELWSSLEPQFWKIIQVMKKRCQEKFEEVYFKQVWMNKSLQTGRKKGTFQG